MKIAEEKLPVVSCSSSAERAETSAAVKSGPVFIQEAVRFHPRFNIAMEQQAYRPTMLEILRS
jgi:uncharacterized protein YigE (DUF2233 family)